MSVELIFSVCTSALALIQRIYLAWNLNAFKSHPYITQRGGMQTLLNAMLAYSSINLTFLLMNLGVPCVICNIVVVFGVMLAGMTALERMIILYIKYHTGVQFRNYVKTNMSKEKFVLLDVGGWILAKSKLVMWTATFGGLLIETLWFVLTQKHALMSSGISQECNLAFRHTEFVFIYVLVILGGSAFIVGAYFLRTVKENFKIVQELKMAASAVIFIFIVMTVWLILPTPELTVAHFTILLYGFNGGVLAEFLVFVSGVWVVIQMKKEGTSQGPTMTDVSTRSHAISTEKTGDTRSAKKDHYVEKLKEVLDDPKLSQTYEEFLLKEFAVENILAYKAIVDFERKQSNSKDDILNEARMIYNVYLSDTSKLQVNLPSQLKHEIAVLFESISQISESNESKIFKLMQDIKAELFNLMKNDSFRRFLRNLRINNDLEKPTSLMETTDIKLMEV